MQFTLMLFLKCSLTSAQQNEVIIQLPENTKLDLVLGEHRWPEFLNNLEGHNRSKTASYIFEYNYRSSGEPGNRT